MPPLLLSWDMKTQKTFQYAHSLLILLCLIATIQPVAAQTLPAAPSGLSALALYDPPNIPPYGSWQQHIFLIWSAPQNSPVAYTYYSLERKTGANGTWTRVDLEDSNFLGDADTNLPSSTTFVYRVRAETSAGVLSAPSNEVTITTLAAPPPTPITPTGLAAVPGFSQVQLSWNASPSATSYLITIDGPDDDGSPSRTSVPAPASGTLVTATIPLLTNGESYGFSVAAVTTINNTESGSSYSPTSDSAWATPTPIPPPPTVITPSTQGNGSWNTGTQPVYNNWSGQLMGTWQYGFTPCEKNGSPLSTLNDNLYSFWDNSVGPSNAANNGYASTASYINSDNSLNLTGSFITDPTLQGTSNFYNSYPVQGEDADNYPSTTDWNSLMAGSSLEPGYYYNLGRMPNGDLIMPSLYMLADNCYYPNGDRTKPLVQSNGTVTAQMATQLSGYYKWNPQFIPASGYTGPTPTTPPPPVTLTLKVTPDLVEGGNGVRNYVNAWSGKTGSLTLTDSFGDNVHADQTTQPWRIGALQPHLVQAPVNPTTGIASVSMTATIAASATNQVPLSQGYAEVEIIGQMQAWVQPDTTTFGITLNGTTKDSIGVDNILVGQNCTPNLVVNNLPSGVYVGWPQWSISGNTYESFDIAPLINVSEGQQTGMAVPYPNTNVSLVPPPIIYLPPTFYWKDNGRLFGYAPETISVTAILYTDPAGALSQNPVLPASSYYGTLTTTKTVNVWTPDEYDTPVSGNVMQTNPELGTVGIDSSLRSVISNDPSGNTSGFQMQASVVTPDLFTSGGKMFGNWAWLQLVQTQEQGGNNDNMQSAELDSSFPYNTSAGAANGVPGTPMSAAGSMGMSNKPIYNSFPDSPDLGWAPYDTNFAFTDAFNLYVMYQPPDTGYGVNWIPLYLYKWGFSANMTRFTPLGSWSPNPPGSVTYSGGSPHPNYPSWNSKFTPSP